MESLDDYKNFLIEIIENKYGLKPEDYVTSDTRKRDKVNLRRIMMVILKKHTKSSLASIGKAVGGKDHASVLHMLKTHEELMAKSHRSGRPVNDEYAKMFASVYYEFLIKFDSTLDKVEMRNSLLKKIEELKMKVSIINYDLKELQRLKSKSEPVDEQLGG